MAREPMPRSRAQEYPFMQYFVVMIDYGRRGREAIVDPENPRRDVIAGVASGEYKNISFIHEIADAAVDDITAEILAEAALPEITVTGPICKPAASIMPAITASMRREGDEAARLAGNFLPAQWREWRRPPIATRG